jgi:hypothetical protein
MGSSNCESSGCPRKGLPKRLKCSKCELSMCELGNEVCECGGLVESGAMLEETEGGSNASL